MLLHPVFNIEGTIPAFPRSYSFLSTVNATNGGTRTDWVDEMTGSVWGDLASSNRWILGTTNDSDQSKDYQQKLITADQYTEVDAGNARITFTSDLTTFTGDFDAVNSFCEFFNGSDVFLGRQLSPTVNADAGSGTPNPVTVTAAQVPPGTRKMRFGWQSIKRTGTENSCYVRNFTAELTYVAGTISAVVVFAETEPNNTGWTTTTGAYASYAGNAGGAGHRPGTGRSGGYAGGSGPRHTHYKDFAFPSGWAAKVAAGDVSFLFRATASNTNLSDDVGVRITFVGSASGAQDTGRVQISNGIVPLLLSGAVPTDATSIRVQYDFLRDDGTICDSYIHMPSLLLFEI